MNLLQLLSAEAGPERRKVLISANLAGVANALILASINVVARAPEAGDARAFFMFALLVTLYVICARRTNHVTTRLIEGVLHRIKVRVSDRIARAELDALERVKAAEICDRITEGTAFISDTAGMIANMMQSSLILVFASLYLAWLSPPAFAVVLLLCGVGALKFMEIRSEFALYVRETMMGRVTFLDRLTDLLAGFKEVQFGRRRRRDLREHIVQASDELRAPSVAANNIRADGIILGDAILFALLTTVVYTLHLYVHMDAKALGAIVSAVLFLFGPFMTFMLGLMPYIRANLALEEIAALEQKLEDAARQGVRREDAEDPWRESIGAIEASRVEYEYPTENGESFRIGPLSFRIDAGEVVFIVGGNGSGKSTLLKVLTGLYAPTAGALLAGGIAVRPENVAAYRDRISAIFSDFHLFAKLYGLAGVDEAAVRQLIVRMRLEGQTSFVDGAFTRLALSTGQKKRVAMIVTLLEARPICVFDEWAADQDPEFRRYFYEELLPLLRQEGKTVIVVSHDDRYFHCADRVVTMKYGRLHSIEHPRRLAVTT